MEGEWSVVERKRELKPGFTVLVKSSSITGGVRVEKRATEDTHFTHLSKEIGARSLFSGLTHKDENREKGGQGLESVTCPSWVNSSLNSLCFSSLNTGLVLLLSLGPGSRLLFWPA